MLPGSGGEITYITYENLEIHNPIWFNIYIGPQQQKQPGGAGPGCMFYPLGDCETQPLITMHDITLRNIKSHGGILFPGVIRCNETHPCDNFVWDNVEVFGWFDLFGLGYITEQISGVIEGKTFPKPHFANLENEESKLNVFEIIFKNFFEEPLNNLMDMVVDDLVDLLDFTDFSEW